MSNYLAQAALALVKWNGSDDFNSKFEISEQSYVNCREQGFHLKNWKLKKAVSFSEHRNSDQLVVYYGTDTFSDFSPQGNVPSDHVYHTQCKYFDYVKLQDAALFIVQYLTKE